MQLPAIIEALLIASEDPLASSELARLVRARVAEAEDILNLERESKDDSRVTETAEAAYFSENLAALAKTDEDAVTAPLPSSITIMSLRGAPSSVQSEPKAGKYTPILITRPLFANSSQEENPAGSVDPPWKLWPSSPTGNPSPRRPLRPSVEFPVMVCYRNYWTVNSSK